MTTKDQQAILFMWSKGKNTAQIARELGLQEHEVYNFIAVGRHASLETSPEMLHRKGMAK